MDLEISTAQSTFCTAWKGTKISVGYLVQEINIFDSTEISAPW